MFISEEEALALWRERLAEQGEEDLTRYLDVNPLHASLNVKLVQADAYAAVVSELRSASGKAWSPWSRSSRRWRPTW